MLLPYFLTSLKPLDLLASPPLSSEDFINRAEDCLSTEITEDLKRLLVMKTINHHLQPEVLARFASDLDVNLPKDSPVDPLAARYLYWAWLKATACAPFVKRFADDACQFYQKLAHLLAEKDAASPATLPAWLNAFAMNFSTQTATLKNCLTYDALERALTDVNPATLENAVSEHLLVIVDNNVENDAFSVDHVFAYFIKLMLCERHALRNKAQGHAILASILSNVIEGAHYERA